MTYAVHVVGGVLFGFYVFVMVIVGIALGAAYERSKETFDAFPRPFQLPTWVMLWWAAMTWGTLLFGSSRRRLLFSFLKKTYFP